MDGGLSRRRAVAGAGAALVGGSAVVADFTRAAGGGREPLPDWPMSRYDAAGTGYNPDARGPRDGATVRWKRGANEFAGAGGAPVLWDGTLYAAGSSLVALGARSGERRFLIDGSSRSDVAVAEARAYRTPTLALGWDDRIVGVTPGGGVSLFGFRIGTRRWRSGADGTPLSTYFGPPSAPSPVAIDGTVYAYPPRGNRLLALDAGSGREKWSVAGDRPVRPAVRDGRVYVPDGARHVRALDAETGEPRWRKPLGDAFMSSPTAADEAVIVPDQRGLTARRPETGERLWRFERTGLEGRGAVAVADGTAYVAGAEGEDTLFALDVATGETLWSRPETAHSAKPAVAGDTVYVCGGAGVLALDAATGETRWSFEAVRSRGKLAVSGGLLFVVTVSGAYALEEA